MIKRKVKEIVTQECNLYGISKCIEHFDCSVMIDELYDELGSEIDITASEDEFKVWKTRLLQSLYRRVNFAQMLRDEDNREVIYPIVYSRMKNHIREVAKLSTGGSIDDELKINRGKRSDRQYSGTRSVAYKLSRDMYKKLYPQVINESTIISSSMILNSECYSLCSSKFPLTYPDLVERLERKDNEFWTEMVDVVKNFVSLLFYKGSVKSNRDEEIGDFSMSCIEVLQKQSDSGDLAAKSSATHLLNSIHNTCRNKLKEYYRRDSRNKRRFAIMEDKEWLKMEDDSNLNYAAMIENKYDILDELDLSDIDLKNNHEVSSAVVHLLLCRDSQFYKMMVGKKEEDVDILMWHNLDEMSYDQIAVKLYGEATDKNKATIRQRCSRISDWLKSRFIKLVEEYRKGSDIRVAY